MAGKRRIIDFYGGHAVAGLGYGHPDIIRALETQAEELFFQSNAVALDGAGGGGAAAWRRSRPPGLDRVFFGNSGAEANENALRVACRVTGRARRSWRSSTASTAAPRLRPPSPGLPSASGTAFRARRSTSPSSRATTRPRPSA